MRLRYSAILGATLLLFCFGWILGTTSSFNTCKANQTAAAKSEKAKKNSPPLNLTVVDNATISARCALHVIYEYRDAATAVATVFIALFTFTLWWSTRGMLNVARAQSIDLKSSVTASQTSADAALKSAETGEKALFAAYRPLITITELELRSANTDLGTPHIHFGIRNSGQGIGVVHWFKATIILRERIGSKMVRTTSVTKTEWVSLIEKGETASGNSVTTPTIQARMADILNGQLALYVTIELEVQDFFLNRTTHQFPFIFDPPAFRRIGARDDGAPRHGDEKQETENPAA